MNVAGYVRVSTEKQKKEGSHRRQRKHLKDWADQNGHKLRIYQDIAISGQSTDRPSYNELMGNVERYDAVVVRELSRFGRSLKRVLQDVETLDEKGVEFISLKEDFDTSTAMGTAMMQLIGVFNEFWANLSRDRTLEMIERRRENGEHVGRPPKHAPGSEVRKDIVELRDKGVSWRSISKIHDLSVRTVQRYYNEETSGDGS